MARSRCKLRVGARRRAVVSSRKGRSGGAETAPQGAAREERSQAPAGGPRAAPRYSKAGRPPACSVGCNFAATRVAALPTTLQCREAVHRRSEVDKQGGRGARWGDGQGREVGLVGGAFRRQGQQTTSQCREAVQSQPEVGGVPDKALPASLTSPLLLFSSSSWAATPLVAQQTTPQCRRRSSANLKLTAEGESAGGRSKGRAPARRQQTHRRPRPRCYLHVPRSGAL